MSYTIEGECEDCGRQHGDYHKSNCKYHKHDELIERLKEAMNDYAPDIQLIKEAITALQELQARIDDLEAQNKIFDEQNILDCKRIAELELEQELYPYSSKPTPETKIAELQARIDEQQIKLIWLGDMEAERNRLLEKVVSQQARIDELERTNAFLQIRNESHVDLEIKIERYEQALEELTENAYSPADQRIAKEALARIKDG